MSEELTKQMLDLVLGDPLLTTITGIGLLAMFIVFIFRGDIKKMKGIGTFVIIAAAIGALMVSVFLLAFFLDIFRAITGA